MTEPPAFVALTPPVRCVLWTQPELAARNAKTMFESVEVYEDDNHFSRSLLKCSECGQLYFYELYEWVDWKEGNDKIYTTFLPVAGEAEIEALKATDIYELMRYFPRLQWDAGTPVWRTL